jgi:predicted transcriptional regulator
MTETAITVHLGDAEIAALDRHVSTMHSGQTREQVIIEIVAHWAATQTVLPAEIDEGLKPDELNASNDA